MVRGVLGVMHVPAGAQGAQKLCFVSVCVQCVHHLSLDGRSSAASCTALGPVFWFLWPGHAVRALHASITTAWLLPSSAVLVTGSSLIISLDALGCLLSLGVC